MRVSGRNRLPGVVTQVTINGLMAQVGLRVGDQAMALVKATSVMIVKE